MNWHHHAKNQFTASIHSWDTANFRVPWPGWPHPFLNIPPKTFWSTFNLCEFVSTCKKSGYFINLFWRYGWLKNPARKRPDRRKDGQTLFYRTLPATAGGSKICQNVGYTFIFSLCLTSNNAFCKWIYKSTDFIIVYLENCLSLTHFWPPTYHFII